MSSAHSGKVSEPYKTSQHTAAESTLPFVDNLMLLRRHKWCTSVEASRAFWIHNDNSESLPSGVRQLTE